MTPAQVRAALEKNAADRVKAEAELKRVIRERQYLLAIQGLQSGNSDSTVVASMETDHRLAISKGRSSSGDKKFNAALAAAGYSITSLAERLKVDKSTLSRYRNGRRKTPREVADRVSKLIGWPADSWPDFE